MVGRRWLDELVSGAVKDTAAIAEREGCSERSVRMTLSLAFLSPKVVRAIVDAVSGCPGCHMEGRGCANTGHQVLARQLTRAALPGFSRLQPSSDM